MPRRHARRRRIPFGAVVAILLAIVASVWIMAGGGSDAGTGPVAGAGEGGSTGVASGGTDDAATLASPDHDRRHPRRPADDPPGAREAHHRNAT
jgi:hypothetical protein